MELGPVDHPGGEDLNRRLDEVKRELDALQTHVLEKKTPVATISVVGSIIISVVALGFSFWTTHQSNQRNERQDRHAAHAELRSLIQRLQALPLETFEIQKKYPNDPDAQNRLTSLIGTETHLLTQQAIDLVQELEGEATGAEINAIVTSLIRSNKVGGIQRLIDQGLAAATDAETEGTLLRAAGSIRFSFGDAVHGRAYYAKALKVFEKYPDNTPSSIAFTRSATEAKWAQSENGLKNCDEARRHIALAEDYAEGYSQSSVVLDAAAEVKASCGAP